MYSKVLHPFFYVIGLFLLFSGVLVSYILFVMQMSLLPLTYVGYMDGVSHHTQHIASAAWIIYTPDSKLFCSGGVFLGTATNNIVEYMFVVSLLVEASSRGISNLVVRLDSQLVIMQLSNHYHVHNPTLLRNYLRVHLLEHRFDTITYEHVPQELNIIADFLANYVLYWNLSHFL